MSQISNLTSQISAFAIIVAGGSGTRMQSALPKQFLLLNGKPVLMYTIEAFQQSIYQPGIILVMHPNFHTYWQELCAGHNFTIPHTLVSGGETRFHSVKNGLDLITEDGLVAVQDAVRPLTNTEIIDNAYQQAAQYGNAVVAVKSRDSVRALRNGRSESLLRDEIYLVQTPQTFKSDLLKKAYQQPFNDSFTDDASVVEKDGQLIHICEGNYQNFKDYFSRGYRDCGDVVGDEELKLNCVIHSAAKDLLDAACIAAEDPSLRYG